MYNREGANDIKQSLKTLKGLPPDKLRGLEQAVDKALATELQEDEDYAILYLDANNLWVFLRA